jgi:DNA-binding PadR family transcriptional regulator
MTDQTQDISSLLPLREPTFFILLSLADGEKHGYAIIKDVADLSRGSITLGTGTLYEALARLLDQALIERVEEMTAAEDMNHPGRPRKSYRLTLRGQRVVDAEIARLQDLIAAAQRRLGREPNH